MTGSFKMEGDGLEVGELLREAVTRTRAESVRALMKIGVEVTAAAKEEASKHSKSIPATIRMVPGRDLVEIHAGGSKVPLARLYELGNIKKRGRSSTQYKRTLKNESGEMVFFHPVYGQMGAWAAQKRYPFLAPARRASRKVMGEQLKAAADHGLEPLRTARRG